MCLVNVAGTIIRLPDWRFMRKPLNLLLLFIATAVGLIASLVGCGGGGVASIGGLNVFLTDSMATGYDHIWVTVKKIEVQDDIGTFYTLMESTDGEVVDLTNLTDGSARFLFVGTEALPLGLYTAVRVTLSTNLTVLLTGDSTGLDCVFDPSIDAGGGLSQISFDLTTPISFLGSDDLAIDFDLPNWNRSANVVTPVLAQGDTSTIDDPARHESEDYHGTISSLSGIIPIQTLTLTGIDGTFAVETDANTVVYNEDASANPALANGKRVEVTGIFIAFDGRILASSIKIEDDDITDADDDKVKGVTTNVSAILHTFDVTPEEADGFVPPDAVVHIQTSVDTKFFGPGLVPVTQEVWYDILLAGAVEVEVEGVYNATENVLVAAKVKLHHEDGDDHEATAYGFVTSINSGAGSFAMTLDTWFGFSSSNGTSLSIVTGLDTAFEDEDGNLLTSEAFFVMLVNGAFMEVEGVIDGGVLHASEVKIEALDGSAEPQARGYVSAFNEGADTITLSLVEWHGFTSSFGESITISTASASEFRNLGGDSVTKAAFFALLESGVVVKAKGTFSVDTLTASRVEIND